MQTLKLDRQQLSRKLSLVSGVAGKGEKSILIRQELVGGEDLTLVGGEYLTLVAYDLTTQIMTTVDAQSDSPGGTDQENLFEIVLDYDSFSKWVNLVDQPTLTLKHDGTRDDPAPVKAQCGKYKATFKQTNLIDYFSLMVRSGTLDESSHTFVTVDKGDLLKACERVLTSRERSGARPILSGIYFRIESDDSGDRIEMVSSDGFRMSRERVKITYRVMTPERPTEFILDGIGVIELAKVLRSSSADSVRLTYDLNSQRTKAGIPHFQIDKTNVAIQMVEGKYPNYKAIIEPTEKYVSTMTVDKRDFARALKLARMFAFGELDGADFSFQHSGGVLTIFAQGDEVGDVTLELEAVTTDDLPEGEFRLSTSMMADCVPTLDNVMVQIAHQSEGNGSPVRVQENDFVYVVMPMVAQ